MFIRKRFLSLKKKQLMIQRTLLQKLRKVVLKLTDNLDVVLDDEYNCAVNILYFHKKGITIEPEVKFKRHSKFPTKYLAWTG